MECMINSDNVVRGGLTPKLKDVDTLMKLLPFEDMKARDLLPIKCMEIGKGSFCVEEYNPQEF